MEIVEILERAYTSPFGIAIESDNPELLRAKLYAERRHHHPRYADFTFKPDPKAPRTVLWITKPKAARAAIPVLPPVELD